MQCTAELLRRRWYGDATTLILPGLLRRLQARRNLSRAGIVEPAAPSHFLNLKGDDSRGSPQDYKPQLARLAQSLDNVAERLHGVEQSPILQRDAEYYTAVLERGGEGLIRSAARELERQASNLERAGRDLAAHTRSAYEREAQDFRMWTAGGVGVLAGIFLILLLPRFLPFSADGHVASVVMGRDRVSAGYAMIAIFSSSSKAASSPRRQGATGQRPHESGRTCMGVKNMLREARRDALFRAIKPVAQSFLLLAVVFIAVGLAARDWPICSAFREAPSRIWRCAFRRPRARQ